MKKLITLLLVTMFAGIGFDTFAQVDKAKKAICGSDAANDLPGTRKELRGYTREKCYGTNTSNIGSAIEREVAKATRESSDRNGRNGNATSNNSSSSGTSSGSTSRESGNNGKTSERGTSGSTSANSSSSQSCSSCSSQANALRNSRNH